MPLGSILRWEDDQGLLERRDGFLARPLRDTPGDLGPDPRAVNVLDRRIRVRISRSHDANGDQAGPAPRSAERVELVERVRKEVVNGVILLDPFADQDASGRFVRHA